MFVIVGTTVSTCLVEFYLHCITDILKFSTSVKLKSCVSTTFEMWLSWLSEWSKQSLHCDNHNKQTISFLFFSILNTFSVFLKYLLRSETLRANMLALRTSNFQGASIRLIALSRSIWDDILLFWDIILYCLNCLPLNFLLHTCSKLISKFMFTFFR